MDSLNKQKYIEHERGKKFDLFTKQGVKKFALWPRWVYTPTSRHLAWFRFYYVLHDLVMYDGQGDLVERPSEYCGKFYLEFEPRERYLSLEDITACILKGENNVEGEYYNYPDTILKELTPEKRRATFVKFGKEHRYQSSKRASDILGIDRW